MHGARVQNNVAVRVKIVVVAGRIANIVLELLDVSDKFGSVWHGIGFHFG